MLGANLFVLGSVRDFRYRPLYKNSEALVYWGQYKLFPESSSLSLASFAKIKYRQTEAKRPRTVRNSPSYDQEFS